MTEFSKGMTPTFSVAYSSRKPVMYKRPDRFSLSVEIGRRFYASRVRPSLYTSTRLNEGRTIKDRGILGESNTENIPWTLRELCPDFDQVVLLRSTPTTHIFGSPRLRYGRWSHYAKISTFCRIRRWRVYGYRLSSPGTNDHSSKSNTVPGDNTTAEHIHLTGIGRNGTTSTSNPAFGNLPGVIYACMKWTGVYIDLRTNRKLWEWESGHFLISTRTTQANTCWNTQKKSMRK